MLGGVLDVVSLNANARTTLIEKQTNNVCKDCSIAFGFVFYQVLDFRFGLKCSEQSSAHIRNEDSKLEPPKPRQFQPLWRDLTSPTTVSDLHSAPQF